MPLKPPHVPQNGFSTMLRPLIVASLTLIWTLSASQAVADVSQTPLLLGGGNVPGNLALVPSVEHPTVISVANLGTYNNNSIYTGYFDPGKCYSFIEEDFNHVFLAPFLKPTAAVTLRP